MNDMNCYLGIKYDNENKLVKKITSSYPQLVKEGYEVFQISIGYEIPPNKLYSGYVDSNYRVHIQYVYAYTTAITGRAAYTAIDDAFDYLLAQSCIQFPSYSGKYDPDNNELIIFPGGPFPDTYSAFEHVKKLQYHYLKKIINEATDDDLGSEEYYYMIRQVLDYERSSIDVTDFIFELKEKREKEDAKTRTCGKSQ